MNSPQQRTWRRNALLGLSLLAAACGGSKPPATQSETSFAPSAPSKAPTEPLSDREVIDEVNTRVDPVWKCYHKRLKERPELDGTVAVRLVIQVDGNLDKEQVELMAPGAFDEQVEACIMEVVRSWRFRAHPGPQPFRVVIPFGLRRTPPPEGGNPDEGAPSESEGKETKPRKKRKGKAGEAP